MNQNTKPNSGGNAVALTIFFGVLLALAVALTSSLASCAGSRARTDALIPAMAQAWPGIEADIERAGPDEQDSADCDAMTDALQSKSASRILRVDWARLRQRAEIGIQVRVETGELGGQPGADIVAGSLRERLHRFDVAFNLLRQGAR